MVAPLISQTTADQLDALKARGFATAKLTGYTADLVLWRDSEEDGTSVAQVAQNVLVVLADAARTDRELAADLVETSGEFRKEPPFNVQINDRFLLPPANMAGHITAVLQDNVAFIRALFVLEQ